MAQERPFAELSDAELEDEYGWLRSRRTVHRGLGNYGLAYYYGDLAVGVVVEISLRYATGRGELHEQLSLPGGTKLSPEDRWEAALPEAYRPSLAAPDHADAEQAERVEPSIDELEARRIRGDHER